MKRFKWENKYFGWGVTAFIVIAASIAFFMLLNHLSGLRNALQQLGRILSPFIWGLVIAYLLYPLQKLYQRYLFTPLVRRVQKKRGKQKESPESEVPSSSKGLSILLAELSLIIILVGMIWLVGPQLYSSVENIVVNSQEYLDRVDRLVNRFLMNSPEIKAMVSNALGDISDGFVNLATKHLLPEMEGLLSDVTSGVFNLAKGIYNILIGIIVSVDVLDSREVFAAHGKKILYSVFSLESAEKILNAIHFTNDVFMGFISGKIVDSLIMAIICYAGCLIMKMPYGVLCSFIVGVTNVIPFFGPLFGMIPTTLIILMSDPLKAMIFLIFLILLQQFDGNFLGPKILGSSVGIGGFWVLFSIIVGSGLFGFAGMLLGVPVFVVIYTFFKRLVNRKLERSGLPVDTEIYKTADHIDPVSRQVVEIGVRAKRTPRQERKGNRGSKKTGTGPEAVPVDADIPEETEEKETQAAQR